MVKLLILKNKHNRKFFISSILKQLKLLKNLVAYDLKNESIKREIFLLNFNSKHPVKVKSNLNPTFTGKKEDGKWLLEISQKL